MASEFEQTLVGPDIEPLCHPLLPLASGQRLKNLDLVILRNHIRQPRGAAAAVKTWLLAQIEKNRAAPASDVVETASDAPFVPERFAA